MQATLSRLGMFYPVRLLLGQNVIRYLHYVRQVERLSPGELETFSWGKVRSAVRYAYEHIPYYRTKFNAARLAPEDVKDPGSLVRIPPLLKKDVQENAVQLRNPAVVLMQKRTTSGSEGNPLGFCKDKDALACMDAAMYHSYGWHGIEIGAPQIRFWGMPLQRSGRLKAYFADRLMNRRRVSAFDLADHTLRDSVRQLRRFRPQYFYGYPSLIFEYAVYLRRAGIDGRDFKIKAVIGTGELVLPQQRAEIESAFGCRFVNEYGCTEIGVIALECPKGSMHVMAHNVYLEVIRDGRQVWDQEGEILVTELNAKSSPFIRYRLGDRGVLSRDPCDCGLALPVMKIVNGRIDGYILTPSGKKVYDAILAYTLKKGILAFKAIQVEPDHIEVYVIPDGGFDDALRERYERGLQSSIDPAMRITFKVVDELPREPSGKLRYFIRKFDVSEPFGSASRNIENGTKTDTAR